MKVLPSLLALAILANCVVIAPVEAAPTWHRIDCPAAVEEAAMNAPKAPAGWTAAVSGPANLHSIDVTTGPPERNGILKPKDGPSGKNWSIDRWPDLREMRLRNNDVFWLACNYGRSRNLILGQRLNENVSECKATYRKDIHGGNSIDFQCKW